MKIGGIQKFSTVDYPGHTCAAIFTIGCNMRCGYCHNPELVLPEWYIEPIPEEDILAFLETRRGLLDGVAISGGEPTMQKDLPEFARRLKSMGFLVKLDSNGTHPGVLAQMIDERLVDFIAMDIKGPLDRYSQIAARPIDVGAIMQSVALIKTVPHEFRTTIVRGQLVPEDFYAVGELVCGADRFALQRYRDAEAIVSPQFMGGDSFTDGEMEQARQIMAGFVKECVVH